MVDTHDETLIELVAERWASSNELATDHELDSSAIRRRLVRLYERGEINRREKPTGQRGYQYSQLEPEQANTGYQGNEQLFESMLGGD
jgi:predicted transcriptional regulator